MKRKFESEQFEISPYDEFGLFIFNQYNEFGRECGIVPWYLYAQVIIYRINLKIIVIFSSKSSQTIDSSTWTTEITGRVLFKYKKQSGGNLD